MAAPRVLILRAPGTNCDAETAYAFELAGAEVQTLHVRALVEQPARLDSFQVLCLPGGFSYGDDIAAGRILASQLELHLHDALRRFRDAGKLVLGICNGFQVLIKAGMLFEENGQQAPATLTYNDSGRLEDRWVRLVHAGSDRCPFFSGVRELYLPVAHGEGKFVARDEGALARLEAAGQLLLRYARLDGGSGPAPYPDNPNGSQGDVAGMCDASGRVCGLMPHPERHVDPTHHPHWTRRPRAAEGEGLQIFRNAVSFFG